jgi:hypothetical protein
MRAIVFCHGVADKCEECAATPFCAKFASMTTQADRASFVALQRHGHYLIEEAGGLLGPGDLKLSRIPNAPPEPYTRGRFDHTYQ